MKTLRRFYWAGSLILLSACSFHPTPTVLQPVGPAPLETAKAKPGNQGYLVVFSAWSSFVDVGSVGHHSRYNIASDDGKLTKEVLNYADRFDEGPIRLPLPPGSYHVTARSARFGRVVVPVIIQEHQTTYVYLDGSPHPEAPQTEKGNTVKLPNGQVVGWSASAATPKTD
jgi:hypothetical protein